MCVAMWYIGISTGILILGGLLADLLELFLW